MSTEAIFLAWILKVWYKIDCYDNPFIQCGTAKSIK